MRRKTVASRQLPSKIVQSCQVGVLAISPDALLNDHTRVEVPSHLLGKQHGFLARRPVAQHAHVTFSHYAIFEYALLSRIDNLRGKRCISSTNDPKIDESLSYPIVESGAQHNRSVKT